MKLLFIFLTALLMLISGCSDSTTTTTTNNGNTVQTPGDASDDGSTNAQSARLELLYGAQLTLHYSYNSASVTDVALMDNNVSNSYLNGSVNHDARSLPFRCMTTIPNTLNYEYFCAYLQQDGWYTFGFRVQEEGLVGGFAFVSSSAYLADEEHALEKVLQSPDATLEGSTILYHANTADGNGTSTTPEEDSSMVLDVQENGTLPQGIDQDYLCYDYADGTTTQIRLMLNGALLTDTYGDFEVEGSYTSSGSRLDLDLSNFGVTYNHIYHLMLNDSVDFFQGYLDDGSGYPDLLSCITTRHDETDKVSSVTNFNCRDHGTFSLEPSGWSSFVDNSANLIYGTYYSDAQSGQFLLHYMLVDINRNVSLVNFPAKVKSPTTIEISFSDGNESCSY